MLQGKYVVAWGKRWRIDYKTPWGKFRGDGNVLYYNWDGSDMGEYICQNTLSYKMCAILLYVNYNRSKLIK